MNFFATPSSGAAARLKTAALLCALWLFVSLLLAWSRITSPAYGIEADLPLHYHITRAYAYSFNEGNLFPRWAGILDGGRGDALFTFYPPLAYIPGAFLMKFAGIDPLTSLKFTTVLILFLAQASAYCFGRAYFPMKGALIVSLFYVLLPGFPLIALKLSFFANAFALALAPFAFRGAHELLMGKRPSRGLVIFALGMSGVILSHVITTYLCGVFLFFMTLVSLRQAGWRGLARLAGAGLLVFALTAFFLVPLKIELGWVRNNLQVGRHDYRDYFLFSKPKDNSEYRATWAKFNDSASSITLVQTSLVFLFCFLFFLFYRGRSMFQCAALIGCVIAGFSFLISLSWSAPVWKVIPGLGNIQFPWRLLPFASLGCGLAAASVFFARTQIMSNFSLPHRLVRLTFLLLLFCFGTIAILFTSAIVHFRSAGISSDHIRSLFNGADAPVISLERRSELEQQSDFAAVKYQSNPYFYRPRTAELMLYPPIAAPNGVSIPDGAGHIDWERRGNQRRIFSIVCNQPTQIRIDTFYYPHWVVRIDRSIAPLRQEAGSGLMLIDMTPGHHEIDLSYEPNKILEIWANRLSWVSWGLFLGWIFIAAQRERGLDLRASKDRFSAHSINQSR